MSAAVQLAIHPDALHIVAGSGSPEVTSLQLNNISFTPVLFRLKTTAPKRYVVKPSKGIIQPNGIQFITISLHEKMTESTRDEFRLEYSALRESDSVSSTGDNIPDILAARDKSSKWKRDISMHVRIAEAPSAVPSTTPPPATTVQAHRQQTAANQTSVKTEAQATPASDAAARAAAIAAANGIGAVSVNASPVFDAAARKVSSPAPTDTTTKESQETVGNSGANSAAAAKSMSNEASSDVKPAVPSSPAAVSKRDGGSTKVAQQQNSSNALLYAVAFLFVVLAVLWGRL